MNFKILNFSIAVSRKKFTVVNNKTEKLSQKDIDVINNDIIDRLVKNSEFYYQNKLIDITLDLSNDSPQIEAVNRIKKDGIFIIPNYLNKSSVNDLCRIIEDQSEAYLSKLDDKEVYEDELAIVQKGLLIKKTYSDLVNSDKPVVNIRSGLDDDGMIDIFNVDQFIEDEAGREILDKLRKDDFFTSLLNSLPKRLSIENINSYVNNGITKTRGFHVDSYSKQIKIFIYLTDVLFFDDGPYVFVKNTHINSPYRRVNKCLSKDMISGTETPIIPFDNIYPVLAPKGSLVVSDQAGFHRGFPQSLNGSRRILTINCK